MIVVSACLMGVNCKYSGESNYSEPIVEYLKDKEWIPVCPEQLGGLSTPRLPSEIIDGEGSDVLDGKARIINTEGQDVTKEFIKGAEESLRLAQMVGAKEAILKASSPSCGRNQIYDGTFKGVKKAGSGVTASLFRRNEIKVISEKDF